MVTNAANVNGLTTCRIDELSKVFMKTLQMLFPNEGAGGFGMENYMEIDFT